MIVHCEPAIVTDNSVARNAAGMMATLDSTALQLNDITPKFPYFSACDEKTQRQQSRCHRIAFRRYSALAQLLIDASSDSLLPHFIRS